MSTTALAPRVSLSPVVKDWRMFRDEMFARVPALTNGRWTDLNESDTGVAITENLIGMIDSILYYLDKQANEVTFVNAIQRRNVQNSLKLIGYELRGYAASTGFVTFSTAPSSTPPAFPITIPKGTQVGGTSDSGGVISYYTLVEGLLDTVASGTYGSLKLAVIQGEPMTSPEIFYSDGTANQRYVLRLEQAAKDLITVKVGFTAQSAVEWSMAESFLSYTQNDQIFVPLIDANGNAFVTFGDGKFGSVPPLGQNIYVYAVRVSGSAGNLAPNTVTRVVSQVTDRVGNPVSLIVTNVETMTGGADPESIEEGKRKGPALFSGLYRAMSKKDYIALTESISSVDKANAWGEQEDLHPNLKLINRVTVSFLALNPSGGVMDPSAIDYPANIAQVQSKIFNLLEERKPITTRIVFKRPEWADVLIDITVAVNRTFYDPTIVGSEVKLAVQNYLSYDNVSFGQDARLSLISQVVSMVSGVSWAQVKLGKMTWNGVLWTMQAPDFVDIPVSKWQLIRVNDFTQNNIPVLGVQQIQGARARTEHILVTTTTNVDAPIPDQMPDPCQLS